MRKESRRRRRGKPPLTKGQRWIRRFIVILILVIFLKWLLIDSFTIPTSSMENSLLSGDMLAVSKLHYGSRTPITPLQVPFSHQTIWGTNITSYLDLIQLPTYRLPGFTKINRNDVVVFNIPVEDHPTDMKTRSVKRCVAISGDTIEINNTQIIVNGKNMPQFSELEFSYLVKTRNNSTVNDRVFEKTGIWDYYRSDDGYGINATPGRARELANYPFIQRIIKNIKPQGVRENSIFPNLNKDTVFQWNRDYYGPLIVPSSGMTLPMNRENILKYLSIITRFEENISVKTDGDSLLINNRPVTNYTFKNNYYFVLGDNRHNSLDSRYWGFLPEDHVVGKALFVWFSYDNKASYEKKLRLQRIFTLIQ